MINIGSISANDAVRQSSSLDSKKDGDKKVQVTEAIPAIDRVTEKDDKNQQQQSQKRSDTIASADAPLVERVDEPLEQEDTYDKQGKKSHRHGIDFTV